MKGIVRNYRKELARRQAKEVSFCELPEIVVEKLIVWDDYESEYTTFDVCGTEIRVLDEELAEALKQLPEQSRNIECPGKSLRVLAHLKCRCSNTTGIGSLTTYEENTILLIKN